MSALTPQSFPKAKPVLSDLPDYVKDPANFRKIELALLDTLTGCRKSHSEVFEMSQCTKCTTNMLERRTLMKTFGFKTPAHYLAWKKVHHKIQQLIKMPKYNKK